jgi:hypothetical protein
LKENALNETAEGEGRTIQKENLASKKKQKRREKTSIAVGDVNNSAVDRAKEHAYDSLPRNPSDSIIVVDNAKQHHWMHHHLLNRSGRNLLSLYHIHLSIPLSL